MNGEQRTFRPIAALALLVVAGLLVFAWARVPRYQGKTMGYWFYKFRQERFPSQGPKLPPGPGRIAFAIKPSPTNGASEQAVVALRALDSEAALYLVQRLKPRKGRFWNFYGKNYSRIPNALKPILPLPPNDPTVQQAAMLALTALGESAKPGIPSVIQMIADTSLPTYSRWDEDAVQMLVSAHPSTAEMDALIAVLLRDLRYSEAKGFILKMNLPAPRTALALADILLIDDSNSWAMRRLETMGTNAKPVVPFLITNLSNPSSAKRSRSLHVLGILGTNATEAFDEVNQRYLHDSFPEVRLAAAHALSQIAPDGTNAVVRRGATP